MFDKLHDFLFASRRRLRTATEELMHRIEQMFDQLSREFNATVAHEPCMLSLSKPWQGTFNRFMVSTSFWALSIRAQDGAVEFFMIPSTEISALEAAETASRSKLRLCFDDRARSWKMDNLLISESELNTLARSLLKDLIVRSQGEYDLLPESMRLVWGGLSLTRSVRSLVQEKHALMQKIVDQQEFILNKVARDLHDAVLGNVMLLERAMSSSKSLDKEEARQVLSQISGSLREICHDLYPRDLKDLGLFPLLGELCLSFSRRTGVEAKFTSSHQCPDLSDEVLLHIYRIAQECLNNVGKHAEASLLNIDVSVDTSRLIMTIKDNGRGVGEGGKEGVRRDGLGAGIIKERADLIDCIYPCSIGIDSRAGEGTVVTLEIMFASPISTETD